MTQYPLPTIAVLWLSVDGGCTEEHICKYWLSNCWILKKYDVQLLYRTTDILGSVYCVNKFFEDSRLVNSHPQGNLSLMGGGQDGCEESLPSTGERVGGSFELVSEGECDVSFAFVAVFGISFTGNIYLQPCRCVLWIFFNWTCDCGLWDLKSLSVSTVYDLFYSRTVQAELTLTMITWQCHDYLSPIMI